MSASIDIFIKDGKVSLEVSGVEDATCEQLTQALQMALGDIDNVQHKPQYYMSLDNLESYIHEGE